MWTSCEPPRCCTICHSQVVPATSLSSQQENTTHSPPSAHGSPIGWFPHHLNQQRKPYLQVLRLVGFHEEPAILKPKSKDSWNDFGLMQESFKETNQNHIQINLGATLPIFGGNKASLLCALCIETDRELPQLYSAWSFESLLMWLLQQNSKGAKGVAIRHNSSDLGSQIKGIWSQNLALVSLFSLPLSQNVYTIHFLCTISILFFSISDL